MLTLSISIKYLLLSLQYLVFVPDTAHKIFTLHGKAWFFFCRGMLKLKLN